MSLLLDGSVLVIDPTLKLTAGIFKYLLVVVVEPPLVSAPLIGKYWGDLLRAIEVDKVLEDPGLSVVISPKLTKDVIVGFVFTLTL